jgi:hypothetical protein
VENLYYVTLVISFIGTIFWSFYFWKMISMKKFEKFSVVKLVVRYLIPGVLLLSFGFAFLTHASNLKAVITNTPAQYAGDCEILLEAAGDGEEPWLEADLTGNWAIFNYSDYPSIEPGYYYCEVEYYPATSEGTALHLYKEEGGEAIKID